MGLLARAGDLIRDEDGAVIATVARDLYSDQPLHCSDITFADGRRRVRGEAVPRAVWQFMQGRRA